ncbi:MAG: hypothetical protein B7Z69_00540 [Actinobacteria bacterium 21-73-9]|nr:MAG: hypothetical protein B7Z69_00540 [Actinobacteria bacterium 21-73-9]
MSQQNFTRTGANGEGIVSDGGVSRTLDVTTATVIKASSGRVCNVNVIVAGSTAGTVNDVATTGGAAAANQVATIPDAVGNYSIQMPCLTGIVVVPGTGQTVAVSYI